MGKELPGVDVVEIILMAGGQRGGLGKGGRHAVGGRDMRCPCAQSEGQREVFEGFHVFLF